MKKKPYLLSAEDSATAKKLLYENIKELSEDQEMKKEIQHFVFDIEKTYDVNFSIEDALSDKTEIAPGKMPRLASTAYTKSLQQLTNVNKDNKDKAFENLKDHYKAQIAELQKHKNPDLNDYVLYFYVDLSILYLSKKLYKDFLFIFNKLNKLFNLDIVRSGYKKSDTRTAVIQVTIELFDTLSEVLGEIYGNHSEFIESIIQAMDYGFDDHPCLILGETGTGKEIIARLMHQVSERRENKYWPVNCGGFTETLFNSEIQGIHWSAATGIGTRLGAFLSACGSINNEEYKGYYLTGRRGTNQEIACRVGGSLKENPTREDLKPIRGTLFLDEINTIHESLQTKLLRAIQENEVFVEGEGRTRPFYAKIICASNTFDSDKNVICGLKHDLYYRVSHGVITMPPLREMTSSIGNISRNVLRKLAKEFQYDKKIEINKRAMADLKRYNWPGNHRELNSVLYRALKQIMLNSGTKLGQKHLKEIKSGQNNNKLPNSYDGQTYTDVLTHYLAYLYNKADGNISQMARLAGFSNRKPLQTLMKKVPLEDIINFGA